MMKRLKDAIHEERRRLIFVTSLAFIAGVLLYSNVRLLVGGVPLALITGLAYAALIGPITLVICVFVPRFRFMMDAVAVSRLILALFAYAYPTFGFTLLSSPLLQAVIVVGGGVAVSRLIHGRILRQPKSAVTESPLPAAPRDPRRRRPPARLSRPNAFQRGFVGWVDGKEPIAV